jgi:hypothetical protein
VIKQTKVKGWTFKSPRRPLYRLDEIKIYSTGIKEDFAGYSEFNTERKTYDYTHRNGILTCYPGLLYDMASGGIDYKFDGSLPHDCICWAIGDKLLDSKYQKDADRIMRDVNIEAGDMNVIRAYISWSGVRLFQSVNRWQQRLRGRVN